MGYLCYTTYTCANLFRLISICFYSSMLTLLRIKHFALVPVLLILFGIPAKNLSAGPSVENNEAWQSTSTGQFDQLLVEARKFQSKGDHKGALAALEIANDLAKELKIAAGILAVLVQKSDLYLNVGQIEEAKKLGQQALNLARELENQPALMASALNNWGTVLTLDRDYESAIEAFKQGLELAQTAEDPSLTVLILSNLAKAAKHSGARSIAKEALYESADLIEQLQPSRRKALLQSALAIQLQDLLEKDDQSSSSASLKAKVRALWKAVKAQADSAADTRLKSNACGHIARLYEMEEDYDLALQKTRQALFFAQQGPHPEMIYRWQWQLGRIFKKTGQTDQALRNYQNAVKSLTPIRSRLMFSYRSSPEYFKEGIKPVYYELAALYIEAAETAKSAQEQQLQLQKARLIIEQMKAAEVEDFFQDECATALRNKATSLDKVGDNCAVIYPMAFENRLVIIANLPGGIVQFTSLVDQKTLTQTVFQFRKHLQNSSNQSFVSPGKKLHYWMIRPLEEKLREADIDTLIFIPDGVLSLIPVAALYDGEHFLIEDYAIVTTPGLQLTDPQPTPRENLETLLVGLSESVQEFPALPNVPEELNIIDQALQSNSMQLLDQSYEKQVLIDTITKNPYRIIHMATHGEFSADPSQTFLLTYDGKLSLDQFGSLIKLGKFSDKPVELLTLSACNTAVGDVRAAFGLAGIALDSGARSAIATLWSIHDEATMLVMTDFYRQFQSRPEINKAQALQAAQLNLLNQPQYKHPAYWSPFLFIGNWL